MKSEKNKGYSMMKRQDLRLKKRVIAIVHVYYSEFWPELVRCLRNIDDPMDLVVTYVDETKGIPEMVHRDFPSAKCILCENRGFDIWPFLKALRTVDFSKYSILVKLHTKRDAIGSIQFNHCDCSGSAWRTYLLGFINSRHAWKATKKQLSNPHIGMVADRHVILSRNDASSESVRKTFDAAVELVQNIYGRPIRGKAWFVAGTMFACKPLILSRLLEQDYTADDFTLSFDTIRDGTMAHVIERALGIVVAAEGGGFRIATPQGGFLLWRMFIRRKDFLFWNRVVNGRRIIKVMGISVYRGTKPKQNN